MNAPLSHSIASAPASVTDMALTLYEAALGNALSLSDRTGVMRFLEVVGGATSVADRKAARRIATDLAQRQARFGAALTMAVTTALAMAEDVAEGATDADLHAVLAQIADLLDGALSLASD